MSSVPFAGLDFSSGEGRTTILLIILLIFTVFFLLYTLVMYVLSAVGFYSIAKRRSIHHPWLAWIPIGSNWLAGSISDQYQHVAKGRVRNRRKVLLGLCVPVLLISVVNLCLSISSITGSMVGVGFERTLGLLLVSAVMNIVSGIMTIILMVFQSIVLYDVFASCVPKNAVLFLVLHLLFGFGAIFLFACRKKDLGMPFRKHEQAWGIPQPTGSAETADPEIHIIESTVIDDEPNETSEME